MFTQSFHTLTGPNRIIFTQSWDVVFTLAVAENIKHEGL